MGWYDYFGTFFCWYFPFPKHMGTTELIASGKGCPSQNVETANEHCVCGPTGLGEWCIDKMHGGDRGQGAIISSTLPKIGFSVGWGK